MGTDIHPYVEVKIDGRWMPEEIRLANDRNYWAFAVLADVRNGEGFAGCDTGNAVTPIAAPRGIPSGCSIRVDEDSEDGPWLGDHSFSWVLLSELRALDLETPITQRGMVTSAQAKALAQGESPEAWCGWTNVTDYVQAEWRRPLRDAAWLLLKWLDTLRHYEDGSQVRIIFGFDS